MFECLILNKDKSIIDYSKKFSKVDKIIIYSMRFFKEIGGNYMIFKNDTVNSMRGCLFFCPEKNICLFYKNLIIPNLTSHSPPFNLHTGKVLKMHKGPEDNFEIQIDNGHGIAWLQATGKMNAKDRVQKVFPNSEILEVTTT